MGPYLLAICNGCHAQWTLMTTKPNTYRSGRALRLDLLAIWCGWQTQWTRMYTKPIKYRAERLVGIDLTAISIAGTLNGPLRTPSQNI